MAEFKAGDVVRLKSGGPDMTVEKDEPNVAGLLCTWFDGKEKVSRYFRPEVLEIAQHPDETPGVFGP